MTSLFILRNPELSKSAVESTVNVVAVEVSADATSVVLLAKPKLSILSRIDIVEAAGIALLSLLSIPRVIPVKVVAVIPVYDIVSLPILALPGTVAVAAVKPEVEPTVKLSESAGKKVTTVEFVIAAVVAALIVIVVPEIAVTVVPAVTPATSTTSPT